MLRETCGLGTIQFPPAMSASACIETCRREPACKGVTLSETRQTGLNSCYVLSEITRWDLEAGYASWTKNPVPPPAPAPAPPTAGSTVDFGPAGGRSSDPTLPFFVVTGATEAVVFSIGFERNRHMFKPKIKFECSPAQHFPFSESFVKIAVLMVTVGLPAEVGLGRGGPRRGGSTRAPPWQSGLRLVTLDSRLGTASLSPPSSSQERVSGP